MILKKVGVLLGFVVLGGVACSEIAPTGVDPSMLPDEPVTVEIRIPWDDFASNLQAFGGFGTARDLGFGVVAHQLGDSLEARTLVAMNPVPTSATVRDSAGTSLTDTLLHVLRGRLIAVVDTLGSVATGPVTLEASRLHQAWDAATATWTSAVDSLLGTTTAWEEPGAAPVTDAVTTVWERADGDSIVFALDSAGVALWSDTASTNQGLRLASLTAGARLRVLDVLFQVDVNPSSNPDSTVVLVVNRNAMTFVYTPDAPPPDGSVRVGGTPSWRSTIDLSLPATITGSSALCDVVSCPLALTAARVSYAALVLTSQGVDPAFMPSDSLNMDVRPVFDASALPKAPLGTSLLTNSVGKRVAPAFFGASAGTQVEIPITSFVRSLLEPDTSSSSIPPPSTLALLSTFEPGSLAFGSFFGPGTANPPVLKLIVTVGKPVELP